ncbi:unnamed protein product [Discosporangium mesarthrocarpum]
MSKTISGSKIASPYAEALFQVGINYYLSKAEQNIAKPADFCQIVADMEHLSKIFKESPIFEEYLINPLISNEKKKLVLETSLSKNASYHTKNFLNLLVDKKRIGYLNVIVQVFLEKAHEFLCFKNVDVYSAHELKLEQKQLLKEKLQIILGSPFSFENKEQYFTIILNCQIDNKILGGFIIKIGSKIIDLSLLGDLQGLAKQLNVTL